MSSGLDNIRLVERGISSVQLYAKYTVNAIQMAVKRARQPRSQIESVWKDFDECDVELLKGGESLYEYPLDAVSWSKVVLLP